MCGHVGTAGALTHKDEGLMKRLLIFDYFRGTDSTGVAAVRKNKEIHVAKIASHPVDLFDTKSYEKAMSGYASKVFIGHNRAATRGKVTAVNAHPFHYDGVVGAHNGTLTPASKLALEKATEEEFGTDSEAIFACISKFGIEETVKMLDGAWALVWYDQNDDTVNFLRNKERPFWLAYSEDNDQVFWTSEYKILDISIDMAPTEIKLSKCDKGYFYHTTEIDMWYRIPLDELSKKSKDRKMFKVKTLKGKEPAPVNKAAPFRQQGSVVTTIGGVPFTPTGQTTTPSKTFSEFSRKDGRFVFFEGSLVRPYNGLFSREEFEDIGKHGCSFCGSKLTFESFGTSVFIREGVILGPCCTNQEVNRVVVSNLADFLEEDEAPVYALG